MTRPLYIYRIRKTRKGDPRPAPGVGRKIAMHFNGEALDCVLTSANPKRQIADDAVIWNYGRSSIPPWMDGAIARGATILNHPERVAFSVDKRLSLQKLAEDGVPCLASTTDREWAQRNWINNNIPVIVRHTVTGKQGRGVELVQPPNNLPNAPLYTEFYNKTHEFRVHVVRGQVVDYVQKKRMGKKKQEARGLTEVNEVVRNHKRGWVFAHQNLLDFHEVRQMGVDAVNSVGLDVCAVDILARVTDDGHLRDAVVCEVNSAPGMTTTITFNAYMNAIREVLDV